MKIAVIGCGMISQIYLKNMTTIFPNIEVVACCDRDMEFARRRAEEFGIEARTNAQVLEDPAIEMVVVLTPAPTHYAIIKEALLAGKHVYTEKVLSHEKALAEELVQLAKEKNLYLGSAPDTFLGAALQKVRQLVDGGEIGEVTSFHVGVNRCLDRLLCKFLFLRLPAGGICYDFGVYHLTALVNTLGPIKEVCAVVENRKPVRVGILEDGADYGKEYRYDNEAQVTAIIRTESGVTGTFVLNGESIGYNLNHFYLYGTKGVLQLADPNNFGGDVTLIRGRDDAKTVENDLPYGKNSRGIGPSEMAQAIAEGRQNRASSELALHVLDVIECMVKSTETGGFVLVGSTCKRPEAL